MIDKRMMYSQGQRVAKAFGGVMGSDGRRQYGGGSDMGASGGYGYQGGSTNKEGTKGTGPASSGNSFSGGDGGGGDPGGYKSPSNPTGTLTGDDYKRARRDFDVGVAGGYAKNSGNMFVGPMPYGTTISPYQKFLSNRPQVKYPPLMPGGFIANTFFKEPIQKFADFTASKNRPYFMNEVVRAGRIPGLNYGTVSEMTNEELEAAYRGYLSDRLNNKTDAYGNPNPGYDGGGEGSNQGIATLYNNNMFDDNEESTNSPFVSRYLQNQPEDIRTEIESRMQNYYTV